MFVGQYEHTVDAKGRLIMPSRFREQLGEHFMATVGLDRCLAVYSDAEWAELEKKIYALPLANPESRRFSRFILANAAECEIDKQGRMLLPQNLRNFAGLVRDVVLAGVGGRIEIWDKEKWEAVNTFDDMEEIAASMEELGF